MDGKLTNTAPRNRGKLGRRRKSRDKQALAIDIEVGRRIKARRRLLGINLVDLGRAVGVSYQQIHKYEVGRNRVSASRLRKLSEVLDLPVSSFFPDEVVVSGRQLDMALDEFSGFLTTTEGRELNVAFGRIRSADLRKRIVAIVKVIAGSDFGADPETRE